MRPLTADPHLQDRDEGTHIHTQRQSKQLEGSDSGELIKLAQGGQCEAFNVAFLIGGSCVTLHLFSLAIFL